MINFPILQMLLLGAPVLPASNRGIDSEAWSNMKFIAADYTTCRRYCLLNDKNRVKPPTNRIVVNPIRIDTPTVELNMPASCARCQKPKTAITHSMMASANPSAQTTGLVSCAISLLLRRN